MADPAVELVILDFAGVCTPSMAELVEAVAETTIPIRPGIDELIVEAKATGATVMILSNEISTDWELSVDIFSTVDQVVSCGDNKIWKPDRRAFQRCLHLSDRSAAHTLLVDDDIDNITVAASLGMHTIHFDVTEPEQSIRQISEALR